MITPTPGPQSTLRGLLTIGSILLLAVSRAPASETWKDRVSTAIPGVCSVADWARDWPGCEFEDGVKEGRLHVVGIGETSGWRVAFAPGRIGPDEGGVGWRWPLPEKTAPAVELRYTLEFEPGFDFVKGGKLPGLCGGPKTITGGQTCSGYDGWSVRLMWRRDGRGQAYAYHPHLPAKYGEEFDFPADFRFPIGAPIGVRLRVEMNTAGRRDGTLGVWITLPGGAEQRVVARADLEWTREPRIGVDSVLFNVFHGGNDLSWAPAQACALRLSRLSYRIMR